MEAMTLPSEPDRLVTKDDLRAVIAAFEARLDVRFAHIDARFAQMEATLTRRMVAIMGAWTVSVGSAFAWASVVFG